MLLLTPPDLASLQFEVLRWTTFYHHVILDPNQYFIDLDEAERQFVDNVQILLERIYDFSPFLHESDDSTAFLETRDELSELLLEVLLSRTTRTFLAPSTP